MNFRQQLKAHLERLPGEAGWAASHLETGMTVIYNHRKFLAASTIKLPILALYAMRRLQSEYAVAFAETYVYNPADYCEDSPCFDKLEAGTEVSWDTLAEWMMVLSDNTATNLLIDKLGLAEIQAWILAQGWRSLQLNRRMMDLEARQRGIDNWASPFEMMQFMEKLAQHTLLPEAEANQWMLDVLYRCQDLEKIPFLFKPPVRVANKPGELPGTRSDVGLVSDGQHQVVMALFCDGLPDTQAEQDADLWLAELAQLLWHELTA